MDFEQRLEKAVQRGQRASDAKLQAQQQKALSEEELKRLHAQYRLQLSEHIESCLKSLANHFPGFQFESVVGDRGWGAAVSRDDLTPGPDRRRANLFSRLELTVRPHSSYNILELTAKGTIRNKEIFNRAHYQPLPEVTSATFRDYVDRWVLEYAEMYAAKS